MVNENIGILKNSHVESVSYFKRLEELEKIRRNNSPGPDTLPIDNKERFSVAFIVGKFSKNLKATNKWCHYCGKKKHNKAYCRAIVKFKKKQKKA
jgi:hypothetical protein